MPNGKPEKSKSLESWIWDAACSIRGAKDAPKYKDYILPLIFTKRLCDVFDDELNRIAAEVGSRKRAFQLAKADHQLVRFYLPLERERGLSSPRKGKEGGWKTPTPLKLYGQEYVPETWAMANMNMIIHDMEGEIEIGDTFKNPKFRTKQGKLRTFDRVVANPMWNQDWFTEADYDADELDRFPAGAGFPGKSSADWGWVQHMLASLNDRGRAAVVLDTGAASRGSGNAGTNKEKTVRQWFVDRDLVESVLYLPENLFYNTTAPGIVLFLNKAKPKARKHKVFLVNASQVFQKGDPKNFIPDEGIARLADTLIGWKEEEKLSRIVDHAELKKNDYNISPSRYIHTGNAETYRPIAEIVEELRVIEAAARETDEALRKILQQLGVAT
jgi:type I restriction enzyme M protein